MAGALGEENTAHPQPPKDFQLPLLSELLLYLSGIERATLYILIEKTGISQAFMELNIGA